MTADHDEPVLDACLDEVLGGRTPPDLTARILRAWASSGYNSEQPDGALPVPADLVHADDSIVPEPPPILTGLPQALVETTPNPIVARRGDVSGRSRRRERSL